jgi:magnesium transporter
MSIIPSLRTKTPAKPSRTRNQAPAAPKPVTTEHTEHRSSSSVIDAALYRDGHRIETTHTLGETYRALHSQPGAMAWISLDRPSPAQIYSLAREFELHDLLVEDAVQAHQRPKLERFGSTLFIVMHAARYLDAAEEVTFTELHVLVGPDYVVTIRHGDTPSLTGVRQRMEANPELLALGPEAVAYAVMDTVVDGYAPVVRGLGNDLDEIVLDVFTGDAAASRRTYELSGEVAEFQRAVRPLQNIVRLLVAGFEKYNVDEELRSYLRDVDDHLLEAADRIDLFRTSLRDILTVSATLMTQQQMEEMRKMTEQGTIENEQMKKVSAWAAIIVVPTLISGIYGMNFTYMPELEWRYGYLFAWGLMLTSAIVLLIVFRKKNWI